MFVHSIWSFLWLLLFFIFSFFLFLSFSFFLLLHQQQRLWEEIKLWQGEFGILVEILHFLLGRKFNILGNKVLICQKLASEQHCNKQVIFYLKIRSICNKCVVARAHISTWNGHSPAAVHAAPGTRGVPWEFMPGCHWSPASASKPRQRQGPDCSMSSRYFCSLDEHP